jgi:hypothetical protein
MFDNNYYKYYNQPKFNELKKFNFSKFLDGTQKTLSVINQAIPLIYQMKPLYENAKTALKVINIIKTDDAKNNKVNTTVNNKTNDKKKVEPQNSPTYFL